MSEAEDWQAANCRFAEEVLSAVEVAPAVAAADDVVTLYPKLIVEHEAVEPEHGWYVPFTVRLADLLRGKLPDIRWTFDFEEDEDA